MERLSAPLSENTLAPIGDDPRLLDPHYLSTDDFAARVDKARQTISHHLNRGKLRPYLDAGEMVFMFGREYYIHQDLAKLFPPKRISAPEAEKAAAVERPQAPVVSAHESVFEQTVARILERFEQNYERVISAKENELAAKNDQIQLLNRELENRNNQIIKYREAEKQAQKPWWKKW